MIKRLNLDFRFYLKCGSIVVGLAIFTLLFHSYNSSSYLIDVSASDSVSDSVSTSGSLSTSHIQDVIIRMKPVEGWKRGSLATIENQPSIFNVIDKSKIAFPADWNVTERAGKVILVPMSLGTSKNAFDAIVLSTYPSEYANIDESAKIATEMYKTELDDFQLLSMNHTKISGESAIALKYNYVEPQFGRTDIVEAAAIHDQKEYLIQYFTSDIKSSGYVPLLMNILNSIIFKS